MAAFRKGSEAVAGRRAMKVLYILPQPYFLSRGSSFRAKATVDALVTLGHEVEVLCYGLGKDPEGAGYRIHRALRPPGLRSVKVGPSPGKLLCDVPLAWSARRLVKRGNYDVIHGVEEGGFLAAWLGGARGIPYIFDMHSWMSQQIEGTGFGRLKLLLRWFRRMELRSMRGARAVITVGEEMTRLLREELAPDVFSVTLLDCAAKVDVPLPPEARAKLEAEFFGFPGRALVYTGNFHPYQGLDLLVDAVAELRRRHPEPGAFRLLLVGGGEGERSRVAQLRGRLRTLGLEEAVVLCGERTPAETAVLMARADALVSSRITGNNIPLKIYQYLAAGVPLVATRIASHTQVLHEGNAVLGDPTPEGLAEAMSRALFGLTEAERAQFREAAVLQTPELQMERFVATVAACYDCCG